MPSAVIAKTNLTPGSWFYPSYLLFMPDGDRILYGTWHGIRVWDLSLQELINISTEDISPVGAWASLLDDQIIMSSSLEGTYNFWDVTDGHQLDLVLHPRGLKAFTLCILQPPFLMI